MSFLSLFPNKSFILMTNTKSFTFIGAAGLLSACLLTACGSTGERHGLDIQLLGDTLATIRVEKPLKYLLLPIEEGAAEGKVRLDTGSPADVDMDVRLARSKVDYFVPFSLPEGSEATIQVRGVPAGSLCWKELQLSDSFDASNRESFRPLYHHTPAYGWMNDPNGLVYKDGEYHLYYQHNPYGSLWGNMHWGHSVSRDLLNWEPQPIALARDTMGHIFSGSAVVDSLNTAGFGTNAIVAFYTSASDRNGQIQCLAYSTDNGRTFTKYEKNPVLVPFDGLRDFRDPKVFWYAPDKKWVMVVSADKEMRFYSSPNLKEWTYMSGFGEGYGVQPNQFECPDFIELPVAGKPNLKKWVLIVNVNPGCYFGGSGTEYFVGDFDGKSFTCDTPPENTKWMDWGKDHYATVCFSNTGDRTIALPWMSNWQYANQIPTQQFRSANALPRELSLYSEGEDIFLASSPVRETESLRKDKVSFGKFQASEAPRIDSLLAENAGAYELNISLRPESARQAGFSLRNAKGEQVKIYLDMSDRRLVMDRTESGITDFGNQSAVHGKENHDRRKSLSINYQNDFALATWAPLPAGDKVYDLRVFVDKCSVEIFLNGGKIAMTNLVFPTAVYNSLEFFAEGGNCEVTQCDVYRL